MIAHGVAYNHQLPAQALLQHVWYAEAFPIEVDYVHGSLGGPEARTSPPVP